MCIRTYVCSGQYPGLPVNLQVTCCYCLFVCDVQERQIDVSYLGCKIDRNGEYCYTPPAGINEVSYCCPHHYPLVLFHYVSYCIIYIFG